MPILARFTRSPAAALATGVAVLAVFGGPAWAAVQPPAFQFFAPSPAVVAAAATAGVPLSGIDPFPGRSSLRPGDAVTALVTLDDAERLTQWLVEITAVEPRGDEKITGSGIHRYTNTGNEFTFGGTRAVLRIRTLGPFEETGDSAAREKSERMTVNSDFLALGLDRMCAFYVRMRNASRHVVIGIGNKPFSPDEVAEGRAAALAAGVSAEDERSLVGSGTALRSFFRVIAGTPGLDELVFKVVDLSWMSVILHAGNESVTVGISDRSSIRAFDLASLGLPGTGGGYAVPYVISLNGRPALAFQLAVTAPRPPLLTTAGVVAVAAGHPDGKGPYLVIRVVSARCARS